MSGRHTLLVSLLTIPALLFSGKAHAVFIPVPGALNPVQFELTVDTPARLEFRLRGGAINIDDFIDNFRPASANWSINFDMGFDPFLPGDPVVDERLLLFGEIFHNLHPPAEGIDGTDGFPFTPTVIFSAGNIGPINLDDLLRHPPAPGGLLHLDDDSLTANCPVCGVGFIGRWDLTLTAEHRATRIRVAEPSTLALLGVGALGLLSLSRKHRRRSP